MCSFDLTLISFIAVLSTDQMADAAIPAAVLGYKNVMCETTAVSICMPRCSWTWMQEDCSLCILLETLPFVLVSFRQTGLATWPCWPRQHMSRQDFKGGGRILVITVSKCYLGRLPEFTWSFAGSLASPLGWPGRQAWPLDHVNQGTLVQHGVSSISRERRGLELQ